MVSKALKQHIKAFGWRMFGALRVDLEFSICVGMPHMLDGVFGSICTNDYVQHHRFSSLIKL